MNEEILQDIEITLNANKDYKEHYHLNDYFEVEYIDKLVIAYKQLQNNWNELKKWLEEYQHKVLYEDVHKVIRDDSERYSFLFDLGHMNICEKTISVIRKKVRELEQGKDE